MRTLKATTASVTDTGCVRARNEDRLYASERLLMVADGMGGHSGRRRRAVCVDAIVEAIPNLEKGDQRRRRKRSSPSRYSGPLKRSQGTSTAS